MRRPIRNRLYTIADLALAFATLEALRLPELDDTHADCRGRPSGAMRCTGTSTCRPVARRRAQPALVRPSRAAHR